LHASYPLNAKVNYGWADPRNLISWPDAKIRELSGGLRVSIGCSSLSEVSQAALDTERQQNQSHQN